MALLEEPPPQAVLRRVGNRDLASRPFSPLYPPEWTAVCMTYLREVDALATRRRELAPAGRQPRKQELDEEGNPIGKAKPKAKPKAKGLASPNQ